MIINLDATKYDEFLRVLLILKDICNDIDIREGILRQRSNDNATIFEIDLTSIISNMNLPVNDLKTKLDIFKCFSGDEVVISTTEDSFTISDDDSMVSFKFPILEFIDNKFITQEELTSVISTNQDDLLLSTKLSKKISDRIRIFTSSFHVNSLQVVFDKELACVSTTTQSKENYGVFLKDIICNRELNHSANLVNTPFVIDHDGDILFETFDSGNNVVVNSFVTTIGNTTTNLYTRASLVEDE